MSSLSLNAANGGLVQVDISQQASGKMEALVRAPGMAKPVAISFDDLEQLKAKLKSAFDVASGFEKLAQPTAGAKLGVSMNASVDSADTAAVKSTLQQTLAAADLLQIALSEPPTEAQKTDVEKAVTRMQSFLKSQGLATGSPGVFDALTREAAHNFAQAAGAKALKSGSDLPSVPHPFDRVAFDKGKSVYEGKLERATEKLNASQPGTPEHDKALKDLNTLRRAYANYLDDSNEAVAKDQKSPKPQFTPEGAKAVKAANAEQAKTLRTDAAASELASVPN